jgi:hypothetical protein
VPAEGTWITAEMRDAYLELAALGWVRSVEVWEGGGARRAASTASRSAGCSPASRCSTAGRTPRRSRCSTCHPLRGGRRHLVDVQLPTDHLRSLGAVDDRPRDFLRLLAHEAGRDVRMRPTSSRCRASRARLSASASSPGRTLSLSREGRVRPELHRPPSVVRPARDHPPDEAQERPCPLTPRSTRRYPDRTSRSATSTSPSSVARRSASPSTRCRA